MQYYRIFVKKKKKTQSTVPLR